jgi:hypothetical protein
MELRQPTAPMTLPRSIAELVKMSQAASGIAHRHVQMIQQIASHNIGYLLNRLKRLAENNTFLPGAERVSSVTRAERWLRETRRRPVCPRASALRMPPGPQAHEGREARNTALMCETAHGNLVIFFPAGAHSFPVQVRAPYPDLQANRVCHAKNKNLICDPDGRRPAGGLRLVSRCSLVRASRPGSGPWLIGRRYRRRCDGCHASFRALGRCCERWPVAWLLRSGRLRATARRRLRIRAAPGRLRLWASASTSSALLSQLWSAPGILRLRLLRR